MNFSAAGKLEDCTRRVWQTPTIRLDDIPLRNQRIVVDVGYGLNSFVNVLIRQLLEFDQLGGDILPAIPRALQGRRGGMERRE